MGERKYYLDWLRVIAFGLLILFHVGMLYVTWGYNIKSPRIYPDFELFMNLLTPWRLTLLFFISGVACRFLIEKLDRGGFATDRVRRLLPVILFGIIALNPIQAYVELLYEGQIEPGYLDFWFNAYLVAMPFVDRIVPSWDHLWFIVYLFVYVLVFALVFRRMQRRSSIGVLLVVPGIWLAITYVLVQVVQPVTHDLVNDWANHLRWIGIFTAGVIFAPREDVWEWLRVNRRKVLLVAAFLGSVQALTLALLPSNLIRYGIVSGLYGWAVVMALSAYAAQYLAQPSKLLGYLTDAVLPVYVLHQPFLIAGAYFLLPMSLPLALEVLGLILITGVGSILTYDLVARRFSLFRLLFGLKPQAVLTS